MKAQTYKDIEKVLINEPVRDIIETALICLETKKRRNNGVGDDYSKHYSPIIEAQCSHGIKKLQQALKAFDKLDLGLQHPRGT